VPSCASELAISPTGPLELDPAVVLALGRLRVDAESGVAGRPEHRYEPAERAATDLHHLRRRRGKRGLDHRPRSSRAIAPERARTHPADPRRVADNRMIARLRSPEDGRCQESALASTVLAVALLAGCGGDTVGADEHGDVPRLPARHVEYSGVGSTMLGPVEVATGVDARWSITGGLFMLIAVNAPASMTLIASHGPRRTERIPPGHYVLKVGTLPGSRWTLTWRVR